MYWRIPFVRMTFGVNDMEIEIQNDRFDFVAPYPLEECRRRLNAQHEKRTFWAWNGQMRTDVKLDQRDSLLTRFEIRRVGKNSYTRTGSSVLIKGELEALSEKQTQVRGHIEIPLFWLLLPMAFIIGMVLFMVAGDTGNALVGVLLLVGGAVFVGFNVMWQRMKLLTTLKNTFRPYDFWE